MKKIVVALALCGLVAAPAFAQETDFATVDADGNGSVTMEEAAAAGWEWTEDQFTTADANGDGGLDAEEFAAATSE